MSDEMSTDFENNPLVIDNPNPTVITRIDYITIGCAGSLGPLSGGVKQLYVC